MPTTQDRADHTHAAPPAPAAAPLASRLWRYQRERFPLVAYLPLIGVSAGAAAAWSAGARGVGLPPGPLLAVGAATALVFFFVLRVADEHKDAQVDRVARPELPVPRGLVSLAELRRTAAVLTAVAVALNALVAPALLVALLAAAAWAALMTREFFVGAWLRARPAAYLLSHMGVMPLLFLYLTGVDWLAARAAPPAGFGAFLALAFTNGVLVEVGRKLRAPGDEKPGVESYTRAWGLRTATGVWLAALALAGVFAAFAAPPAAVMAPVLALLAAAAALPALAFLARPRRGATRGVEAAAALWTLASYLVLALAPRLS
jgi:4-hydroxybenzoate polyprenyltransferase